ncbi:hypothetical protein GCM10007320_65750 [Pseudorhodoferax aquiterrae]|uniref:Uncharacterized protein n=1 Tax=Pseudorhodoferax aquiterrae TaxID=747304 RepID=A0ABQ3GI26_9BURK|nr:hypothetical protein [Pseudorhodoferax aquiterrae]GHD04680.1 hypothetical protein GCM10007320_65750 [Pseudorhodoferax aquiterrae]
MDKITEQELLGLAASAAGYEHRWDGDALAMYVRPIGSTEAFRLWRPLTDDSDAGLLAQQRAIRVLVGNDKVDALSPEAHVHERLGLDRRAAIRRAVVRAAAARARIPATS